MTTAAALSPGADSFAEFVEGFESLAELSFVDAELRFRELEVERRRVEAEQAVLLGLFENRQRFRADGHASVFGVLRSSVHWSDAECRARTKLARLIAAHPEVGEALHDGRISVANAEAIARLFANPRVGDRFQSVLGNLLREAEVREYDDFRLLPERWELIADREARRERTDAHQRRRVGFEPRRGGGSRMVVDWGDLDAARNAEILDRVVEELFDADWADTKQRFGDQASLELMARSEQQRRADALSLIFERAVSTPVGAKKPDPVAVILVDHHTVTELLTEAGLFPERVAVDPFDDPTPLISRRHCETVDGMVINPDAVLQVLLEGYVRFVILDDEGVPIKWGRQRRFFEGAARDAVLCLMGRCAHPGCRVKASRVEIDHRKPYSEGGATDPDNGAPLCRRHNKQKHRQRWRIDRDTQRRFRTYRNDGTEI